MVNRSLIRNLENDPDITSMYEQAIAGIDRNCRLIKGQVFLWRAGQDWEDLWDVNGVIVQ